MWGSTLKNKKRTLVRIKGMILIIMMILNTNTFSAQGVSPNNSSNIVGKDALGRTLPLIKDVTNDKYVGLFYFAWLEAGAYQTEVHDVTKLQRDNPELLWNISRNINDMHHFNEPLYGYYNSADPYVIRKHIELFIAAEIDFITYDFTNYDIYLEPLMTMFDLLNEYYEAGWDVPQVMFFTKKDTAKQLPRLFKRIYEANLYPHLWFKGSGDKPYIIADKSVAPDYLKDFFNYRYPQWPRDEFRADGWPYVDFIKPLRLFDNLVCVSVAQHTGSAFSWSVKVPNGQLRLSQGRGYTNDNPKNGDIDAIVRGNNFQEQWDYAVELDPEIVFVTGWNEWIAMKQARPTDSTFGNVPFWVDTFNTEFSRDCEMTKARQYIVDEEGNFIEEGYGDNFYMQLISNVRKYKGIPLTQDNFVKPVSKTIDINGDISQWNDISNKYINISTKKVERDFIGFTKKIHYAQAAPNNSIKEIRITHDEVNLFFYVKTEKDITEHELGKTNWMNVFIGVEGSDKPDWESYNYVINRYPKNDTTSLEVYSDGNVFEKVCDVGYVVDGNIMQIKVPRKELSIEKDGFTLYFKAADSIEKEHDIMDYYVTGESMPLGRLSYIYKTDIDNSKRSTNRILAIVQWVIGIALIISSIIIVLIIRNTNRKVIGGVRNEKK